jgi:hypothetical protein
MKSQVPECGDEFLEQTSDVGSRNTTWNAASKQIDKSSNDKVISTDKWQTAPMLMTVSEVPPTKASVSETLRFAHSAICLLSRKLIKLQCLPVKESTRLVAGHFG